MLINGILENTESIQLRLSIRNQVYCGPFRRLIEEIHENAHSADGIRKFVSSFMNFMEMDRLAFEKSWSEESPSVSIAMSSSLNAIRDRFSVLPESMRPAYADCVVNFLDGLLLRSHGVVPDIKIDGSDVILTIISNQQQLKTQNEAVDISHKLAAENELAEARKQLLLAAEQQRSLEERFAEEIGLVRAELQEKLSKSLSEAASKQAKIDEKQIEIDRLEEQVT